VFVAPVCEGRKRHPFSIALKLLKGKRKRYSALPDPIVGGMEWRGGARPNNLAR
jgi:hypothetical protein